MVPHRVVSYSSSVVMTDNVNLLGKAKSFDVQLLKLSGLGAFFFFYLRENTASTAGAAPPKIKSAG